MKVSFYPGPSKVYDQVPHYVKTAHKKGILSINHRSEPFMKMVRRCQKLLLKKLQIPKDYNIFFTSSATECWEIIAQSLTKEQSFHIYNGAFGEKWFRYAHKLKPLSTGKAFDRDDLLNPLKLQVPTKVEVICITQNETSNGTQVSNDVIAAIRKKYPKKLLAVDATSSMAGVYLDFTQADIWYASVQKCFGLPAGIGLMVCSPDAMAQAEALEERDHYNSLLFISENMEKFQTSYTPNVLAIYLLMQVMKRSKGIKKVNAVIRERHQNWMGFLQELPDLEPLVKNEEVQSNTVIPVTGDSKLIIEIKKLLEKAGYIVGNGYGDLKDTTFRIANFPAIKDKEIKGLQSALVNILQSYSG